jgi:membrane protein required for colicin V production
MNFNWVDLILLVILGLTVLFGVLKGFVRQIIGIAAVIVGLILAVNYYPVISDFFSRWISSSTLSHFIAFIAVFIAVLCLGGILSFLFSKVIRGPLKFINNALGGGLGLLKGLLICGVVVFAMLVFPFNEDALKQSFLAPYCVRVTKAVIYLIPDDLKVKFNQAYEDIVKRGREDVSKG